MTTLTIEDVIRIDQPANPEWLRTRPTQGVVYLIRGRIGAKFVRNIAGRTVHTDSRTSQAAVFATAEEAAKFRADHLGAAAYEIVACPKW